MQEQVAVVVNGCQSCGWLPVNPETVVEAVSQVPRSAAPPPAAGDPTSRAISFTPLGEVEAAVRRAAERLDLADLVRKAIDAACDKARGRV